MNSSHEEMKNSLLMAYAYLTKLVDDQEKNNENNGCKMKCH